MCDTCSVLFTVAGWLILSLLWRPVASWIHLLPNAPSSPCFVDVLVSCLVPRCVSEEDRSCIRKPPGQWKVSDLDVMLSEPAEGPQADTSESLEKALATQQATDNSVMDQHHLLLSLPPRGFGQQIMHVWWIGTRNLFYLKSFHIQPIISSSFNTLFASS